MPNNNILLNKEGLFKLIDDLKQPSEKIESFRAFLVGIHYDWVYLDVTSDHDLEILGLLNIDVPDAYYSEKPVRQKVNRDNPPKANVVVEKFSDKIS